jgi:ankyrin repeat protein
MFAAMNGHTDMVKLLFIAGADVNVKMKVFS